MIDLLFIEEFVSEKDFIYYFLQNTNIPLPLQESTINAYHSILDKATGETDILVEYESENGFIIIFIENKINATFQYRQIERYHERKSKSNHEAYTVLVAPKEYLKGTESFDYIIDYEYLLDFFNPNENRGKYKQHILSFAIGKGNKTGYSVINDDNNLRFHKYYFEQTLNFSGIQMDEPKVKPKGSNWVRMWHHNLPRINAYHKINLNKIDIEIPNFLREKYKSLIEDYTKKGMLIENKNSCYLSHKFATKVDIQQDPTQYQSTITEAIQLVITVFEKMATCQ